MTEQEDERRSRRLIALFLGFLTLLGVSVLVGAALAPAAGTPPLRLNATPSTVVVTAGEVATYNLVLTRGSERGPVAFTAADLPPATTAAFAPASTTGDTTTLTLRTDGDATDGAFTPAGDYDIVLRATGSDAVAGAVVRLKVQSSSMSGVSGVVQISGTLGTVLRPGEGAGVDVSLTNPNTSAVRISAITVTLDSVTAPRATSTRPCTIADFEVLSYTGPAFMLTPRQNRTLSQLAVPAAQWPQVRMRNTSLNQDGCQGATVTFRYDISGRTA